MKTCSLGSPWRYFDANSYIEQSSNGYTVNGDVTDRLQVPDKAATTVEITVVALFVNKPGNL